MSAACARCQCPAEQGDLRCAGCGLALPEAADPAAGPAVKVTVLRCKGCGAAMAYDAAAGAPRCAFCGEVTALETLEDPLEQAQAALPFRVSPDEAGRALRRWHRTLGWFRPGDLLTASKIDKIRPIFFAAWVCDADAEVSWTADSEVGSRRSAWAPHAGQCRLDFRSVVVSSSRGLSEAEVDALAGSYDDHSDAAPTPPPVAGAEPPLVEQFEVQRSEARARVARGLRAMAAERVGASHVPGSRKRNVHVELLVSRPVTRRLLLPAWILAYRYRGTLYRCVVSGRKASFATGEAPYSALRIAAVALGVAAWLLSALWIFQPEQHALMVPLLVAWIALPLVVGLVVLLTRGKKQEEE